MIRFQPDTPWQALTRFFDMIAPDANVYMEIPAPDLRFAATVLVAVAALVLWRRLGPGRGATMAMLATLLTSAGLWLVTTGNGRYFMPMLVAVGPVAVGLVCALPIARRYQACLSVLLLAAQVFLLTQQPPWSTWSLVHWTRAPYFAINLGPQEKSGPPTTYASLSLLSYSLIAPQFPENSRWINLAAAGGTRRDEAWILDFLEAGAAQGPLKMIAPALQWASLPDGLPTDEAVGALGRLLAPRGLSVSGECRYIMSPGLVRMAEEERRASAPGEVPPGFWICPMTYRRPAPRSATQEQTPEAVRQAFDKVSQMCPRFFPPGVVGQQRVSDGWMRYYGSSETRVFVLDDGQVRYHFWRALNPVSIGTVPDLLAGKVKLDCLGIRSDGAWRTGAR